VKYFYEKYFLWSDSLFEKIDYWFSETLLFVIWSVILPLFGIVSILGHLRAYFWVLIPLEQPWLLSRCHYSNKGSNKDTILVHIPCSNKGTFLCFPYLARQVSSSWHMLDGFFLLERKGKVTWCFYLSKKQWVPIKHAFLRYNLLRVTKPTHYLSLLQKTRTEQKLF
jgi:hypothetical protein